MELFITLPADENRYEGEWKDDKKHGNGKYYHLDKGQVFIGTWVDDIAKCGVMEILIEILQQIPQNTLYQR